MSKSLSIALGVVVALAIVAPAAAQSTQEDSVPQIVAQERGRALDARIFGTQPSTQSSGGSGSQIAAQELGRRGDARLFSTGTSPVLVTGSAPADEFDVADAAVGAAAVGALALVLAAALVLTRTRRTASAAS